MTKTIMTNVIKRERLATMRKHIEDMRDRVDSFDAWNAGDDADELLCDLSGHLETAAKLCGAIAVKVGG